MLGFFGLGQTPSSSTPSLGNCLPAFFLTGTPHVVLVPFFRSFALDTFFACVFECIDDSLVMNEERERLKLIGFPIAAPSRLTSRSPFMYLSPHLFLNHLLQLLLNSNFIFEQTSSKGHHLLTTLNFLLNLNFIFELISVTYQKATLGRDCQPVCLNAVKCRRCCLRPFHRC